MVIAERVRLATKLSHELVELQELEAAANASGDEEAAGSLRERIAAIEAGLQALEHRVDEIGARSWRFDITRDSEKLIESILAHPIQ